jgi:hypothetical protein
VTVREETVFAKQKMQGEESNLKPGSMSPMTMLIE